MSAKIIECPRDSMQGWSHIIDTDLKRSYLQKLLHCGFDTLDFGSFVSPKAIPQMADTQMVLDKLEWEGNNTKLLAIVANMRGALQASENAGVKYLGFPFSVSETFQRRNTGITQADAFALALEIQALSKKTNKEAVVYLSMAFGNPYGDPWSAETVVSWAEKFKKAGVSIISLADTVGIASPNDVFDITSEVISQNSDIEIGIHLHCRPDQWLEKLEASWEAGCRRFDSAIMGIGGCPMAGDALVGNLNTSNLLDFLAQKGEADFIDMDLFKEAEQMASKVFI